MDIYICTGDVRCGRALALEARAAGFSAAYGSDADGARLIVRDLDTAATDGEMGDIRFSRDEERLRAAERRDADAGALYLLYPFDLALFRIQLSARLQTAQTALPRVLTLDTATRRVAGMGGEVRLSARECAMLAALGKSRCLSRAEAAALFGSAAGNVVDVYACYLRKKLGRLLPGEILCARRGEGYALAEDVALEVL